ncbi:MAG TPA: ATP-binding protein [Solirubrobacterales bacterium]|nr:ATP-binding protein [Solirubrobacterales bacterium]
MDAYRNPYTPGAGSRPAALTGRDAEIERFRIAIGRLSRGATEQGIVIHGLRGVGKTVLLNKLEEVASDAGWATAFAELRRGDDFRLVMARALFNAIRQLDTHRIGRPVIARVKAAFASFSATLASDGTIRFGFDVTPTRGTADSGDLETDLVEMLQELGRAAEQVETGAAILLDELQLANRDDLEAFVAAVHRATQKALPIAVVVAGLPTLPPALAEAKTYAERLFSFPRLGALGEDDARDALLLPAREEGVGYDDEALAMLLDRAGGYPYFLQEWGRGAWDVAVANPISAEDVEAAIPEVERKLNEDFFAVRLTRATPAERRYCAVMAGLGDGAQESGAIARSMGYTNVRAASSLRASLIDKGVLYSVGRGQLDFTVPRFAEFMRSDAASSDLLTAGS